VTYTTTTPEVFLAQIEPFDRLSTKTQAKIAKIGQYYRYHIGQPIAMPDRLSAQISIIVEGTVRLLGYPDRLLQLLGADSLKDLALKAINTAVVYPTTQTIPPDLIHWNWFVGSQPPSSLYAIGDRLEIASNRHNQKLRPIGISPDILQVPLTPPTDRHRASRYPVI
jgi:DNA polymerase III psi subunit